MRFCCATSVNRFHRLTNMFASAEHPVAERCRKTIAVYFDCALESLPHSRPHLFVCLWVVQKDLWVLCVYPIIRTDKKEVKVFFSMSSVSLCVWVNLVHLKRVKSCLSQSDSVSCRLCLCSGCVRHREGASYAFSCPRHKIQMRWWNF